jgi:hypothetical protein
MRIKLIRDYLSKREAHFLEVPEFLEPYVYTYTYIYIYIQTHTYMYIFSPLKIELNLCTVKNTFNV